jgi:hypothetical protein
MKSCIFKSALLVFAICYLSTAGFAQGACYPAGVVLLDTGRPANGASVRVCTAGSTGSPCTPAASLFTDPTLGTPLGGSPVVITDSHGNFGFCAAAGANYDLQISGTGITTLNIKNMPLPPTTPIAAASLSSSSANPATVGVIKLASSDGIDWRNNANSGNIQLVKTGAAAGGVPADTLDAIAFGGVRTSDVIIPTTSNTLPGTITNDASGGLNFSNNAGNTWQLNSSGTWVSPPGKVIAMSGSSSGSTLLQPQAAASGTLTLPAATDTLVGKATTDTLTNKTLGGTTPFNRVRANQGSALVTGDVGSLTGFGTTASVSAVSGTDTAGSVTIASSGTGQTVNASFVLTFHDGAFPVAPIVVVTRGDGNPPTGGFAVIFNQTTTNVTIGFASTPVAGQSYIFNFIVVGR